MSNSCTHNNPIIRYETLLNKDSFLLTDATKSALNYEGNGAKVIFRCEGRVCMQNCEEKKGIARNHAQFYCINCTTYISAICCTWANIAKGIHY